MTEQISRKCCTTASNLGGGSVVGRHRRSPWPAITMDEALASVERTIDDQLSHLQSVVDVDTRNIDDILGMVLAEEIYATNPVPAFPASTMDGYAVIAADGVGPRRVVGQRFATATLQSTNVVQPGHCVRITTGAALPAGADSVVPVENTELLEHEMDEELAIDVLKAPSRAGENIRAPGSDVAADQLLLSRGAAIGEAEVGLIALSGRRSIRIFRPPSVSILSTGDELVDPLSFHDDTSQEGNNANSTTVCDTNRPLLISLFKRHHIRIKDFGIVTDSFDEIARRIADALAYENDFLVVSGGVSMGERDFLKSILVERFNFTIHFGRVFMKPGLPTTFASGVWNGRSKFVFALPGNPVSTFVTAHLFVVPMLRKVSGHLQYRPTRIRVHLDNAEQPLRLDVRTEYRRAILRLNPSPRGQPTSNHTQITQLPWASSIPGSHISSRLMSTAMANLLLELPARTSTMDTLEHGAAVTALVIGQI